jgi:hypothetical protein
MDKHEKSAAEILASIEAIYVPTHQYARVQASQFRHLDLAFYDKALADLQALGYRHVADVEDLTISNAPRNLMKRIMIRTLLSRDGTVMAGAYHPKLKLLWAILLRLLGMRQKPVIDLETEFDDGAFVCTSNASFAAAIQSPPLVLVEYLPSGTQASVLLDCHEQSVQAYIETTGSAPRTVSTHEELIQAQDRMHAIKAAYRNEVGGVTREELERASPLWPETARIIHEKVVELRRRAQDGMGQSGSHGAPLSDPAPVHGSSPTSGENPMANAGPHEAKGVIGRLEADGNSIIYKFVNELPPQQLRERLRWLTVIAWDYDGISSNGMPSAETITSMMKLEATIEEKLERDGFLRHAYSRTGNNRKELVYYINDRDTFIEQFNQALAGQPRYPISIDFYEDAEWKDFAMVLGNFAGASDLSGHA